MYIVMQRGFGLKAAVKTVLGAIIDQDFHFRSVFVKVQLLSCETCFGI